MQGCVTCPGPRSLLSHPVLGKCGGKLRHGAGGAGGAGSTRARAGAPRGLCGQGAPAPPIPGREPRTPGSGTYSAPPNDSAGIRPGQPGFPDSAPPAVKLGGSSPSFQQRRHQHALLRGAGSSPSLSPPWEHMEPLWHRGTARQLRQSLGERRQRPKKPRASPARTGSRPLRAAAGVQQGRLRAWHPGTPRLPGSPPSCFFPR